MTGLTTGCISLDNTMNKNNSAWLHLTTGIIIVIALLISAYIRNAEWENEIILWQDVVAKSDKKSRSYNNLGKAYAQAGMHMYAIRHFQKAVQLNPLNQDAHVNLGNEYRKRGQKELAVFHYEAAIQIDPSTGSAFNNLGTIYFDSGLYQKAAEFYRKAARISHVAEFHYNLGSTLRIAGETAAAIPEFEEAVRLDPLYFQAYNMLGVMYEQAALYDKAYQYYIKGMAINPGDAIIRNNVERIKKIKR